MRFALSLMLFAFACSAGAATVYVDDELRVGVRERPNSSEAPEAVVTTGAALEVLERREGYVKIRTDDGVEGWVNDDYVTDELPAKLRIKPLQEELALLRNQTRELQAANEEYDSNVATLTARLDDAMEDNAALHSRLAKYYQQQTAGPRDFSWLIAAGIMVGLFLLGIMLGVQWQRQRSSQRIGKWELHF